jgi:hypothetical protein
MSRIPEITDFEWKSAELLHICDIYLRCDGINVVFLKH